MALEMAMSVSQFTTLAQTEISQLLAEKLYIDIQVSPSMNHIDFADPYSSPIAPT